MHFVMLNRVLRTHHLVHVFWMLISNLRFFKFDKWDDCRIIYRCLGNVISKDERFKLCGILVEV